MACSGKPLFYVKRGDSFNVPMSVVDPDGSAYHKAILDNYLQNLTSLDLVKLRGFNTSLDANYYVDISDWDISASLRWGPKYISDLNVSIDPDNQGLFHLTQTPEVTSLWVPRKLKCDIEFQHNQTIVSSETFIIEVQEDQTHG